MMDIGLLAATIIFGHYWVPIFVSAIVLVSFLFSLHYFVPFIRLNLVYSIFYMSLSIKPIFKVKFAKYASR